MKQNGERFELSKKNGERFECYSKKLYAWMTLHGVRYERSFKHNETGRICWVYLMTDEVSNLLIQWKQNKPNV